MPQQKLRVRASYIFPIFYCTLYAQFPVVRWQEWQLVWSAAPPWSLRCFCLSAQPSVTFPPLTSTVQRTAAQGVRQSFVNPGDGWTWKPQEINIFWHNQNKNQVLKMFTCNKVAIKVTLKCEGCIQKHTYLDVLPTCTTVCISNSFHGWFVHLHAVYLTLRMEGVCWLLTYLAGYD